MQQTLHKSKSSLLREIDMYLKNGGTQIAACISEDEKGATVYLFSRPFVVKMVEQIEYMEE
jgi:hypothetical protein